MKDMDIPGLTSAHFPTACWLIQTQPKEIPDICHMPECKPFFWTIQLLAYSFVDEATPDLAMRAEHAH